MPTDPTPAPPTEAELVEMERLCAATADDSDTIEAALARQDAAPELARALPRLLAAYRASEAERERLRDDVAVAHIETYGNSRQALDDALVPALNEQGQVLGLETRVRHVLAQLADAGAVVDALVEALQHVQRFDGCSHCPMTERALTRATTWRDATRGG